MLPRLVAIAGPTASGKSALALDLARQFGGVIVNGDSRQVYRGMDIGTAKPTAEERRLVPHLLYDIAAPTDAYSLALYLRDAHAACARVWEEGRLPFLVGGTGQYIWALLEDWQVPEVTPDEQLRAVLSAEAAARGPAHLHERLRAIDPVAAGRIDPRNVRRVVRAIEVFEHTGVPISSWQKKGTPPFDFLLLAIDTGRDELDARIAARVDEMFAAGFVEEVQALLDGGVPPGAPAMSSIGYAQVVRFLAGEITIAQAQELTKQATRRFARRQQQWFRRDDPRITWVRNGEAVPLVASFTGRCPAT